MKKLLSLTLILVLCTSVFSIAFAESPAPGGPFNSAFRVQNLETTVALCSYEFYDEAGTAAYTSTSVEVQPGDSLYVYVPNLTVEEGSYSAVVTCDRKAAAVVNFSDPNSGASHSGVAEPGAEWYAPGIYDNFYNFYSNIYVQNASGAPVDITVEIFSPNSSTPVLTETELDVPAFTSVTFEQEGKTELVDNQFYSAKITSTGGDVAPIVNIYGRGAALDQLYSYNPFKVGSLVAYAPIIMNKYYGYDTSLVVQNIGAESAEVRVTYTNGVESDYTIASGAAQSIYTPAVTGIPAGNTLYGATIESLNGQNIVVLVNQSNSYNRAASYSGFASGNTEMRAPIVEKAYYTYNSSVVCQNVGAAPATMSILYAGEGVSTTPTVSPSIDVGGTHQFYQPSDPALASVPANWIGSATITSAQPIVCVVNQDVIPQYALIVQDSLYSYNGIAP
jgi:hypothetical protein